VIDCCVFSSQKRRRKVPAAPNPKNVGDVPPAMRDRMKKAFAECYKAVTSCEADEATGKRKRCELFRELPDKRVSRLKQGEGVRGVLTSSRTMPITTNTSRPPYRSRSSANGPVATTTRMCLLTGTISD